jgi:hypothetical protein
MSKEELVHYVGLRKMSWSFGGWWEYLISLLLALAFLFHVLALLAHEVRELQVGVLPVHEGLQKFPDFAAPPEVGCTGHFHHSWVAHETE